MEKKVFTQNEGDMNEDLNGQSPFIAKQEFHEAQAVPDTEEANGLFEGELLEQHVEQSLQPKPRWWKKILGGVSLLFFVASVAQSVQWLVDAWQQNQWIYFAFSLVACAVILLGISAIVGEWRRLAKLRHRAEIQTQSQQWLKSAVNFKEVFSPAEHQQAVALCQEVSKFVHIDGQNPDFMQWQKQIHEAYSAHEILHLFSQNVLQPVDKQAKKLITKASTESAALVAISPLALVDIFFIAWRNIRLINQIAQIYGIELGYFSRIRLLRMVLVNMAFAGATELIQDLGVNWLSQDLTAKLSARAAQGIGVGILTARLGIKAMEFCRPLAFQPGEKPRLSQLHKELLSHLSSTVLDQVKFKQKENV